MHGTLSPATALEIDAPAVLWRRGERAGRKPVEVAKGPFVILAHGLMTIPAAERGGFWISTAAGRIGAAEAEAILGVWHGPASVA